jgi:hypothetical protein
VQEEEAVAGQAQNRHGPTRSKRRSHFASAHMLLPLLASSRLQFRCCRYFTCRTVRLSFGLFLFFLDFAIRSFLHLVLQ